MKRFFFILLLFPMLCLGLHNDSPQQDKQDIQRIQEQISQIDRDSTLTIETAWHHEGDGDFQYTVYRNADEIVKLKRSLFVGQEELHQTVYFPNRQMPLYVHRQNVMYFDDQSQRLSEEVSYYVEGKLSPPLSRVSNFPTSSPVRISDGTWLAQLERVSIVSEENKIFITQVLDEIQSITFVPAKLYIGRYKYAYDSESFVECHTQHTYEIEDKTLRDSYAQLRVEPFEGAIAIFVATMDLQENMMNAMAETLTVVEFISMNKNKEKACE